MVLEDADGVMGMVRSAYGAGRSRWSGADALLTLNEDLAELETVLDTLLPASSWESYRQDIFHLRRKGQPGQFQRSHLVGLPAERRHRRKQAGCEPQSRISRCSAKRRIPI